MKYRLWTKGGSIDALLDSGAELSLISAEVVQKRAIPTEPLDNPLEIVCADQSRVRASECVPSLPISRDTWSDLLWCVVVPNLSSPLFLGRDWLVKWNPVVDWVTGELTLANVGEPWIPKGDSALATDAAYALPMPLKEMTPSAFRK